jgi:hypothetical protein
MYETTTNHISRICMAALEMLDRPVALQSVYHCTIFLE